MSGEQTFTAWKNKALWALLVGSIAFGVSWGVYVSKIAVNSVTKEDVAEMIQTNAPYIEDRKMIQQQLSETKKIFELLKDQSKEQGEQMRATINKNTEAITALRVEIAKKAN